MHRIEEVEIVFIDDAEDISKVESHHIFLSLSLTFFPFYGLNKVSNLQLKSLHAHFLEPAVSPAENGYDVFDIVLSFLGR